ncbi:MAG TPA: hypothetical protein EYP90_01295, partial [Chromatiaceae bacterium]|nr:hypothetical protein [Chromatiaceae bacterium]
VEGFRHEAIPKIEIHRPSLGTPLLCEKDPHILALACDAEPAASVGLPRLDLNDAPAVAEWIHEWMKGV